MLKNYLVGLWILLIIHKVMHNIFGIQNPSTRRAFYIFNTPNHILNCLGYLLYCVNCWSSEFSSNKLKKNNFILMNSPTTLMNLPTRFMFQLSPRNDKTCSFNQIMRFDLIIKNIPVSTKGILRI